MASPTTSTGADFLLADDFPSRDSLINFLVNQCGWSPVKVGEMFERSDRQVRRIADEGPAWAPADRSDPEPLTQAEAQTMLRALSVDPHTSPEERELAIS